MHRGNHLHDDHDLCYLDRRRGYGGEAIYAGNYSESGQLCQCADNDGSVDQIAGIRLILSYDKEVLAFKDGGKTKATDSLMHIINNTQPGRLVIVMAGAKGISAKDAAVFLLNFTIRKGRPEVKNTRIDIQEVQLMNENLKDVKAETGAGLINIK